MIHDQNSGVITMRDVGLTASHSHSGNPFGFLIRPNLANMPSSKRQYYNRIRRSAGCIKRRKSQGEERGRMRPHRMGLVVVIKAGRRGRGRGEPRGGGRGGTWTLWWGGDQREDEKEREVWREERCEVFRESAGSNSETSCKVSPATFCNLSNCFPGIKVNLFGVFFFKKTGMR